MKTFLFNTLLFFKRPNVLSRIFLIGASYLFLNFIVIPDLKFKLLEENPKKITIEEIKNTPKDQLPLYIVLDKAKLLTVNNSMKQSEVDSTFGKKINRDNNTIAVQMKSYNFLIEKEIDKRGDIVNRSVSYPVYSADEIKNNPNASASDLTSFVIIEDYKVNWKSLDNNKYFTDSTFSMSGKFNNATISKDKLKLLIDGGYNVSDKAIVLSKGSTPMSLKNSILFTTLISLFILICFMSFFSESFLRKIFGLEQEIIRVN